MKSSRENRIVVLVFSSNVNESPIVKREILLEVNKEVVIIAFRIENVLPVKVTELFISAHHWLDAITPPVERHIQKLADKVEMFLSCHNEPIVRYDPIREIEDTAEKWAASGCPYSTLEGINQQLQLLVRQLPDVIAIKRSDALMMLLMAALHFGGEWAFWVRKNEGNRKATRHVLDQLNIGYYRPRFRALFTLQCYSRDEVETAMRETGGGISPGNRSIIEKYVFTRSVPEYLVKIRNGSNADMARRAAAVLKEIERYLGIKSPGNSQSELPVP